MFLSCFFLKKKKNLSEKGRFFDKNHGLTPLQNVDSLEFYRTFLFWSEKHSFFMQNIKKCFFLAFFAQKKHMRKRSIF